MPGPITAIPAAMRQVAFRKSITKQIAMTINTNTIVAEIVAADYRTASVFEKNNIDFCCNGNTTIAAAAVSAGIDPDDIVRQLQGLPGQSPGETPAYADWSPERLAGHIVDKHHSYVQQRLRDIRPLLEKLVAVHGGRHPELHRIRDLFNASAGALTAHMKKEELILFPFILKLNKADQAGSKMLERPHFGPVDHPVNMMRHEHDVEGNRFREIAKLSDNYTPPADACNTYKTVFAMLKEFEEDLHLHIHLENNILFPKALELQDKLFAHA